MLSAMSTPEADQRDWRQLAEGLPPLADPQEEHELVWQQLRTKFQLYHRAATSTRLVYQVMKTVSLVVAAAVPVVAAASAPAALTASLAAVVVVLEGAQQLFQLQPHWISYRTTAEMLRRHAFLYASQVEPYHDRRTRRHNLAMFIDTAVADEGTRWSTSMRQPAASTGFGT
jgi:hypothetical protein